MNIHDTDQVLSAAVYAAVARAYDNERSIEDAADEILDAIEADRKRRGEPVAWRYLTPTGWHATTDAAQALRIAEHHTVEPLYAAPQPAEPAKAPSEDESAAQGLPPYNPRHLTEEEWNRLVENGRKAWGKKPAEPVKVPSDLPHALRDLVAIWRKQQGEYPAEGKQAAAAVRLCANELELLLARYDHPIEPEGWQLVPKEPTEEMLAATSWPNCAGTDYKHMLAAAPKFGEE